MTKQEGASEADLSILTKYRFQLFNEEEKPSVGAGKMVPVETSSGYLANERILLPEDAVSYCSYTFIVKDKTTIFMVFDI